MKKEIKKLIQVSEDNDWIVSVDGSEYTFSKSSPAGQDFNFTVTGETAEEIISAMREYHDNFDCSEETYLWLDNTGHGINGAPYDMKDLYEDIEECADMIEELYEILCGEILTAE